jgi:hypothetical protein
MYAVMQRYTFDPTSSSELTRQITDEWVPLLRPLPGFVAYYWLDSGAGVGAALSVFEDQAGAKAALALAADCGPAHLAALVGPLDILTGMITAYANAGL